MISQVHDNILEESRNNVKLYQHYIQAMQIKCIKVKTNKAYIQIKCINPASIFDLQHMNKITHKTYK